MLKYTHMQKPSQIRRKVNYMYTVHLATLAEPHVHNISL